MWQGVWQVHEQATYDCLAGRDMYSVLFETRQFEIITEIVRARQENITCGDSYSFTTVKVESICWL